MNNAKTTIFKGYTDAVSRHLHEIMQVVVQYYNDEYSIESTVDEVMGVLRAPLPSGKQFGAATTQRTRKPSTAVDHFEPGITCCYKFTKGDDKGKYCGKPVVQDCDKCKACLKKGSKKEPGEKKKKELFRVEEKNDEDALILKKLPGTDLLIHEESSFLAKDKSNFVLAGKYVKGKVETELSLEDTKEALDIGFRLGPNDTAIEPALSGKKVPELPSTPDRTDALPRPRVLIPRSVTGSRLPPRNRPLHEVVESSLDNDE